mmetsp:Transcript_7290/g.17838  ORF Transcript_7290/g.17838 Transcript_7290/m.17838 type:complete len:114 (+) Transcript_7290:252-593(+)
MQQQQEQFYVDPQKVEHLLSHELGSMDVGYRNRINEEIHGVSQRCPEETAEMIQRTLQQLEEELNGLPPQSNLPTARLFNWVVHTSLRTSTVSGSCAAIATTFKRRQFTSNET